MPQVVIDLLEKAVVGNAAEMAPADDVKLLAEVTRIAALLGANWSPKGRSEWIEVVALEFESEPASVLLPALAAARRFVTDGRHLVAWVTANMETKLTRLRTEQQMLSRLLEISAG